MVERKLGALNADGFNCFGSGICRGINIANLVFSCPPLPQLERCLKFPFRTCLMVGSYLANRSSFTQL